VLRFPDNVLLAVKEVWKEATPPKLAETVLPDCKLVPRIIEDVKLALVVLLADRLAVSLILDCNTGVKLETPAKF